MKMRVVNMRTQTPGTFGDDASRHEYEAEVSRARSAQPYRFAIAPRQQLTTFDGRVLAPGDEVRLGDFRVVGDRSPWRQLETLVFRGVVLESESVAS